MYEIKDGVPFPNRQVDASQQSPLGKTMRSIQKGQSFDVPLTGDAVYYHKIYRKLHAISFQVNKQIVTRTIRLDDGSSILRVWCMGRKHAHQD